MNERVMQFRIGMFVIVAGLVLTMLIVWFGESPSLLRDRAYMTVHFSEAPGVAEGIPVRKSGIRIGEVASIVFDHRPNRKDDGVLVTLALERRKTELRTGSRPRITRALIGDVSIDMLPGTGPGDVTLQSTPALPPDNEIVEGEVAPDPSKALEAATNTFQNAQGTLQAIQKAADNLSGLSQKAEKLDEFLVSFRDMGHSVKGLADDVDRVVKANEGNLGPAIVNFRQASEKLNNTFDPKTQDQIRTTIQRLNSSSAKLDQMLTDIGPVARDLGSDGTKNPATGFGQLVMRMNRVVYDVNLLTRNLEDGRGGLNGNGSLQRLFTQSDLYENLNQMATAARDVFVRARPAVTNLNVFAEKVAREPGLITRGALAR